MFGDENKLKRAGEKVGNRFVKKKNSLGKKPGPMIMDMGYFEVLFNEMLNNPTTKVEKLEKTSESKICVSSIIEYFCFC